MKKNWTKHVPNESGYFWTRWKDKSRKWRTTPASVYIMDNSKVISVFGAGMFSVNKDTNEDESKKVFGFKEILFNINKIEIPE